MPIFDLEVLETLESLKKRFPYADDRSAKTAYLSARCNQSLKEDFDYVSRVIEGEEPAIILRRLVRDYISAAMKRGS